MHVLYFELLTGLLLCGYKRERNPLARDGGDWSRSMPNFLDRPATQLTSCSRCRPQSSGLQAVLTCDHTIMPSPLDQPESDTPSQTTTPDPQAQDQAQRLAIEYDQVAAQQATDQADETEQVHSLDVGGGNVVKLDKLGPMIINSDGVSVVPPTATPYHGPMTESRTELMTDVVENTELAGLAPHRAGTDGQAVGEEAKSCSAAEAGCGKPGRAERRRGEAQRAERQRSG